MAGRRSGILNWWQSLSDYKARVAARNHQNNATVTGTTFGWFVVEYDSTGEQFCVKFLADADDDLEAGVLAQSEDLAASTLPDTVSLAEVGGSGVTATIQLDGFR